MLGVEHVLDHVAEKSNSQYWPKTVAVGSRDDPIEHESYYFKCKAFALQKASLLTLRGEGRTIYHLCLFFEQGPRGLIQYL